MTSSATTTNKQHNNTHQPVSMSSPTVLFTGTRSIDSVDARQRDSCFVFATSALTGDVIRCCCFCLVCFLGLGW